MLRPPPGSTLFPYTTLFRSGLAVRLRALLDAHTNGNGRARQTRLAALATVARARSEEHTSELQSLTNLVCRLLLEKKKKPNMLKKLSARSYLLLSSYSIVQI